MTPRALPAVGWLRHPWLEHGHFGKEYLPPEYYEGLLKPYVFDGRTDLEMFESFLDSHVPPVNQAVLEIGPGTGRATKVLLSRTQPREVDLVDQSCRMLQYCAKRFAASGQMRFTSCDAIRFLSSTTRTFSFVFSLWSLSHSIHQNIARDGLKQGGAKASFAIRRLFHSVLRPKGRFFLIHFDTTSEEQMISLRQRQAAEDWLVPGQPSPSQTIIESALEELSSEGIIDWNKKHLIGAPIVYTDLEEALEIFMNFHMEGSFNTSLHRERVLMELHRELSRRRKTGGRISVRPGCFVYTCRRREHPTRNGPLL